MGILAVLGVILVVVGILGLLHVIALGLTWSLVIAIVGVLLIVFSRSTIIRR